MDSRGIAVTWEQWFEQSYGMALRLGLTEAAVVAAEPDRPELTRFHRFEVELRPFVTF